MGSTFCDSMLFYYLRYDFCIDVICDIADSMVKVLKFRTLFSFCFLKKIMVIRAEIHKMLVGKANREEPDQTAVCSVSALFI